MTVQNVNPNPLRSQSGAALIVVLLLLVIITLLGLAAMRGGILQERMAASSLARSIAFQAAESGLRQGELIVRDATVTFPATGCSAGRCAMTPVGSSPAWDASGFWSSGTGFQLGTAIGSGVSAIQPKFVIEDFGQATTGMASGSGIDMSKKSTPASVQNVYRITSYASTPNGGEVQLQSLYKR